jgi:integrase
MRYFHIETIEGDGGDRVSLIRGNTFKAVSEAWLEENKPHWSARYHDQAERAFKKHLYPTLEDLPIRQVTAPLLRDTIKTAGKTAPTVAILLRQWVSAVFRYAVMHDLAEHDPAAALKGLVKRPKVRHNPPLEQKEIPKLIAKLDKHGGYATTKIAIRLLMLTFVRTVELRAAEWEEIDLEAAIWRIPKERMKMGEEHIVPLSGQAVELLKQLYELSGNRKYLFPNYRSPRTCMTATTINRALERMGYAGKFSGHGFRSTASTILNEMGYRSDLIEKQLAHTERNTVRASYNQAQYLDERREMMQGWANLIDQLASGSNVVPGKFGKAKESA